MATYDEATTCRHGFWPIYCPWRCRRPETLMERKRRVMNETARPLMERLRRAMRGLPTVKPMEADHE